MGRVLGADRVRADVLLVLREVSGGDVLWTLPVREDGSFSLETPWPGSLPAEEAAGELFVRGDGRAVLQREIVVRRGLRAEFLERWTQTGRITGRVVGADGAPFRGIRVVVSMTDPRVYEDPVCDDLLDEKSRRGRVLLAGFATTDGTGRFALDSLEEGPYHICTDAGGYGSKPSIVHAGPDEAPTVLVLTPGVDVRIGVRDADDEKPMRSFQWRVALFVSDGAPREVLGNDRIPIPRSVFEGEGLVGKDIVVRAWALAEGYHLAAGELRMNGIEIPCVKRIDMIAKRIRAEDMTEVLLKLRPADRHLGLSGHVVDDGQGFAFTSRLSIEAVGPGAFRTRLASGERKLDLRVAGPLNGLVRATHVVTVPTRGTVEVPVILPPYGSVLVERPDDWDERAEIGARRLEDGLWLFGQVKRQTFLIDALPPGDWKFLDVDEPVRVEEGRQARVRLRH